MELSVTSVALGIGLSAACGFRVFVPLFLMSGAAHLGYLELASNFAWIETTQALLGFGAATVVELLAYAIPWLDNALDALATPAAVGAGMIASAATLGEASPFVQWTLAIVAGGGVAGIVQGGTVATRAASSTGTGGLGNILVATGEAVAAIGTTVLAVAAPLIGLVVVLMVVGLLLRQGVRWRRRTT